MVQSEGYANTNPLSSAVLGNDGPEITMLKQSVHSSNGRQTNKCITDSSQLGSSRSAKTEMADVGLLEGGTPSSDAASASALPNIDYALGTKPSLRIVRPQDHQQSSRQPVKATEKYGNGRSTDGHEHGAGQHAGSKPRKLVIPSSRHVTQEGSDTAAEESLKAQEMAGLLGSRSRRGGSPGRRASPSDHSGDGHVKESSSEQRGRGDNSTWQPM